MEKFKVAGMTCAACSARVERAVRSVRGVTDCSVNLLTGQMSVDGSAQRGDIEAAVVAAGYGVERDTPSDIARDTGISSDTRRILARLIGSLCLLALLMYFSMGMMLGLPMPKSLTPGAIAIIQLVLSGIILIINKRFFISGFRALLRLSPNMDTLVAVGAAVSYIASVVLTVGILSAQDGGMAMLHNLYFETAAMIVTLITLGKLLESWAKGKTASALKSLSELTPKTATVIRDGVQMEIPVQNMRVGDEFILRTGSRVPTDGVVLSGEGAVDESVLSGESIPIDKREGMAVYGATVNCSGYMTCRATKVGEDTVISEIIRMVSDASATKAPIAKLADKVSGVFVPVVLGISLLTFLGWLIASATVAEAAMRGVAVMVISCPCALGLATPVAIMVGSGVGAKRGILYKSAKVLEASGRVDVAVLDKTGTVTLGQPAVDGVYTPEGVDEEELFGLIYPLEKMSEHPLARAITEYAEGRGFDGASMPEITEFRTIGGRGVSCKIGNDILLGASYEHIRPIIKGGDDTDGLFERLSGEGKTPLFFALGQRYLGCVAVTDTLRPDAKEGVAKLSSLGIRTVMLTGDNGRTAEAIARRVGISEVVYGASPRGKERTVKELLAKGHKVMMVGDGVNDAPALASATVGVAIGTGTDIAKDTADVVITGKRLSAVADCVLLGRYTLLNIKENLFWAFVYNCVGIPLAAGLFGLTLDPMFGALAMSLSSFTVVMNALRINLFRFRYGKAPSAEGKITLTKWEDEKMTKIIKVEGMMCPHCEARVKKTLEALAGVAAAQPDHKRGEVTLTLESEVPSSVIAEALSDQGYEVVN